MGPFDSSALAAVRARTLSGLAYRSQAPGYDPRSGEGARFLGGRFNPPGSFPVLYLCRSRPCIVAELRRRAGREVIGLQGLLPREVFEYEVVLHSVLDLTDEDVLHGLNVQRRDVVSPDWSFTQELGRAAKARGFQAILSASATDVGEVLAVFTENLGGHGRIKPRLVETWSSPADL